MDAALRLSDWHSLDAVNSTLEFQTAVCSVACDIDDGLLIAAEIALTGRENLGLPAQVFGVAQVHTQEVAGEQAGFIAAGAGPNLQDDVALIVRVAGLQQLQQL